jgi:hypothetical protein
MRNSELMAYTMYLADWSTTRVSPPDPETPLAWNELTEEQQGTYLRHAEAALLHLFEHGRIIGYIPTGQRFKELSTLFHAYITEKMQEETP